MKVLTEHGFKDFIGIRKSKVNSIYHIEFTDGTHLDAAKVDDDCITKLTECRFRDGTLLRLRGGV